LLSRAAHAAHARGCSHSLASIFMGSHSLASQRNVIAHSHYASRFALRTYTLATLRLIPLPLNLHLTSPTIPPTPQNSSCRKASHAFSIDIRIRTHSSHIRAASLIRGVGATCCDHSSIGTAANSQQPPAPATLHSGSARRFAPQTPSAALTSEEQQPTAGD